MIYILKSSKLKNVQFIFLKFDEFNEFDRILKKNINKKCNSFLKI